MAGRAQLRWGAPPSWPASNGTGQEGGERSEKVMGLKRKKQKQQGSW
jgi:hypothetical protein